MSNYTYSSFSTNTPQSPERNIQRSSPYDYLSNNQLRASQVVATSSQSARVVGLSLPELQANFVLMSAEVDRLLILNSLMSKEAEQWRQKYLDIERLGSQKTTQGYGETDKDKEIKYWKDKNMQTENEYLQKIHNIKTQTEGILREQIEREVKSALKYMEEEKRIMQGQISDLQRERDQLARGAAQNDFQIRSSQDKDREVTYWKEKFQNLEASLEPRIRSAIETRLQETITPILRERDALADQLEVQKRRVNDQEREKRSSPPRDNVKVYIDQLQDYEDRINKLENEKRPLQLENDNLNRKVREYDSVIKDLSSELERLRRSGPQTSQIESDYNNLNRKSREYESELETLRRNEVHRNEDINKLRMDLERVHDQKHDLENRIQNYEREKAEYQHSLDMLKQKFRDFEGKMGLLLEENERLKADMSAKDRELHHSKASPTYEREAHDLKRQVTVLEDRVRDDRNEYARRMHALEDQVNREKNESSRLAEILRSREGEVENWKQKYQNLEKDTQNYIQKLMNEAEGHFRNRIEQEKNEFGSQVSTEKNVLERKLAMAEQQLHDHDREIAHLRDENSHLTSQSNKLTQELNSMRSRIEVLTRESNAKVEEFRRRYEQDQKVYLESELKALQTQLNDKIILYEQEVNRLTGIIRDHELKQILAFIEIERLYLVNGEFIEEINRITEEINHVLADNEKLNQQIVSMRQNNQDRTKYEEIIHGFKDQIDDYEHRIQHLMAENARLSDTSVERLKEINSLKNSYNARSNQSETAKRSQPGDFKKSQADFNELNLRFENEKNKMESQMNQMRQALELGQRENMKLQEINSQRKGENEKLYRELEGLRSSSWTSQNLEAELRLQNEQYQQSLKEVEEMRKARDFYRQQYDQVSAKLKESFNEKMRNSTAASQQNWQQGGPTPAQFASPKGPNDLRFK